MLKTNQNTRCLVCGNGLRINNPGQIAYYHAECRHKRFTGRKKTMIMDAFKAEAMEKLMEEVSGK